MKKYNLFLLVFVSIVSCKQSSKTIDKVNVTSLMDITNYKGNAVVFFRDGVMTGADRFTMQLIPLPNQDTNIVKQDTFDIYKAIKGRPSIFFTNGDIIYKLYMNKQKKELKRNICNISDKNDSYVKVWISYKNYEDILKAKGEKILTDSCSVREIFIGHNGKLDEFKILSPY